MDPGHLNKDDIKRHMENPSIFSDKDTLIRRLEKERDILGRKLRQTIERSTALHNQLAELDITSKIELTDLRNEIAALKRELNEQSEDRDALLNENETLLNEISDRDDKIAEVSRDFQVKDLQFKEFRGDLLRAAERLREWEAKYETLEEEYFSLISGAASPETPPSTDGEAIVVAEAVEEDTSDAVAEELNGRISELQKALEEAGAETASLREHITHLNSVIVGKDKTVSQQAAEMAELKETITDKDNSIKDLDEAVSRNRTLEQEMSKAREDLENAFKHRANEISAIRENYEADMEKLSSRNLDLEAEIETLRASAYGAGDSELLAQLEKEKARTSVLITALTQKDKTIEDLGESLRELRAEEEGLRAKLAEAERLKEDHEALVDRAKALDLSLSNETAIRERAETELAELRGIHQAEMARAIEQKAKSESESARLSDTIRDLEEKISAKDESLSGLASSLSERDSALEEMTLERERMAETVRALENALEQERSEAAKSRESFSNAIAQSGKKMDEMAGSIEKLSSENDSLSRSLEGMKEELKEKAVWLSLESEKLETALDSKMRGLEHKMDSLSGQIEERMRGYLVLLDRISTEMSQPRPEPEEPEVFREAREPKRPSRNSALAVAMLLVLLAAGVFLYAKVWKAAPQAPVINPAQVSSPWAEGIKHVEAGDMDITLTFLNREALGILALSEKVSDKDLALNHYAMLEIRARKGCISEKFDSAVGRNVSFITATGAAIETFVPPVLEAEGGSVYKAGACVNNEDGVVSLRRYLSAAREQEITGLSISGLSDNTPLVTLR